MPNSIETTGTNDDPQSTQYESGQSVRDWVSRHIENVSFASSSEQTLESTWMASGGKRSVTTERTSGESDTEFVERHQIEMLLEMLEYEPVD
jgi:hypothetical protein